MNTSFLQRVAQTFWREKQEQVSELTFVFPNRRAGLFFRKYLAEEAQKPLFAPAVLTINQLFQQLSTLQLADNIDLLFRLYKVYIAERKQADNVDTFDDFLFWGRMMLSDFTEVDQHLVDASSLYANLRDIKEIEQQFNHLTKEQTESVNAFVRSMHDGDINAFRERFLTIWNSLLPIYTRFREELLQDGLAYSGLLQRMVIDSLKASDKLEGRGNRYVFMGFNALTGVEKALMENLRDRGIADFYWDYEAEWLRDSQNRASLFYKQNVTEFPSHYTLPSVKITNPTIHWVRVASSVGQAEVIKNLLRNSSLEGSPVNWTQVGIVLPDENLLLPIYSAIPSEIDTVNITMGQPLRQTAVYALVAYLSELSLLSTQRKQGKQPQAQIPQMPSTIAAEAKRWLYYKPVMSLLKHPYVQAYAAKEAIDLQCKIQEKNWVYVDSYQLSSYAFLLELFHVPDNPQVVLSHLRKLVYMFAVNDSLHPFDKEYLYQLLLIINRVEGLLLQHQILMGVKTIYQLLLQLLEDTSVPFKGEPLQGLQIMGVLESRSMDFHTLIIPDVNDETLPGKTMQNTYIPYDLRLYFGLPTTERQDAIFAYNFYHLISHAQDVWLLQNTLSNDMTSGEVSRYIYQLQYQYNLPIKKVDVNYIPTAPDLQLPCVTKTDEVLTEVCDMMQNRGLSPSTLNTYLQCPLRFYWGTVRQLYEPKVVHEDIESNQLGTVLHKVMEELYRQPSYPWTISVKEIDAMVAKVSKESLVEVQYAKEFYKTDNTSLLIGRDQLAIYAIKKYVVNILEYDKTLCPFIYHGSEEYMSTEIETSAGHRVKVKGTLDRIDEVNNLVRVVDYKTGAEHSTKVEMDSLFTSDKGKNADHYRQTLFYALLYTAKYSDVDCGATIYYTSKPANEIAKELFESFAVLNNGFRENLIALLDEIFNPAIPFIARPETKRCEYCPFAAMCGQ